MIELGVSAGPARESRSFTETVVSALVAAAAGTSTTGALATGALAACAGAWSRAFGSARVEPATLATAAVTPGIMADLARRLVRAGDALYVLDVTAGRVALLAASHWDVLGDADPDTWTYHATVSGPTATRTRVVPAAGVVHV